MATPVIDALQERSQRPVIQQQVQRSPIIAQALLAQGMSPEPVDSGWEALGRLAQTWAGNRLQNELLAQEEADRLAQDEEFEELLGGLGLDQTVTAAMRALPRDQRAGALFEYVTASGGDPFTLSPDQIRYDAAGNIIAQNIGPEDAEADWQRVTLFGGPNGEEENWEYFVDPANPQNLQPIGRADVTGPLATATATVGGGPTVGWEAIDRAFATDVYTPWVLDGGFSDYLKQTEQLQGVLNRFSEGENLTGPLIGLTPDRLLNIVNPGAVDARDQVLEVVQRNLRLILGAQFTEREGQLLMERAYNPNLDDAVNARRLTALIQQMDRAAQARQAAVDWFNEHGTMQGFTGTMPGLQDFYEAIDAVEPASFNPARPEQPQQMPIFEPGRTYTVINGQIVPVPPQGGYGGNDPWQQLRGSP